MEKRNVYRKLIKKESKKVRVISNAVFPKKVYGNNNQI